MAGGQHLAPERGELVVGQAAAAAAVALAAAAAAAVRGRCQDHALEVRHVATVLKWDLLMNAIKIIS